MSFEEIDLFSNTSFGSKKKKKKARTNTPKKNIQNASLIGVGLCIGGAAIGAKNGAGMPATAIAVTACLEAVA